MTKLALVVDKAEAYVNFQRDLILSSWGVKEQKATQLVKTLDAVGMTTLFGGAPTSLMDLETPEEVKALVKELTKKTKEEMASSFSEGLLVTTTVPRTQTKKLESLFKDLGGEVVTPPGKGELSLGEKIISHLSLRPEVKAFALAYVGDDYPALISLVTSLSSIPRERHQAVSEQDVLLRFPQPPGSLPPWDVEAPLLRGDMPAVLNVLRRTHPLPLLAVLKNKFQLAFRIASLKALHPSLDDDSIATALGVPKNYPFKLASQTAKQQGVASMLKAVTIIEQAETNIKGASAAPSQASFEASMAELCEVFRR